MSIYRDSQMFMTDETFDGGDSAHISGLKTIFGESEDLWKYVSDGLAVRCPSQGPKWTNPWNVTPDQLLPLVAGLHKIERYDLCRDIFWQRAKQFFFCQDRERDLPGTTKHPYPHTFINDQGLMEARDFDFATPLLPDSILCLIMAGKIWWLYWFSFIGMPFFFLGLWIHCKFDKKNDEGQQLAKCYLLGGRWAFRLYKYLKPGWIVSITTFFDERRKMQELSRIIISDLSKY